MALVGPTLALTQYADFSYLFLPWVGADGNPINFAGCTATLTAKYAPTDAVPILSLPSADGSIVLGPVTGGPTGDVPAGCVQVNVNRAKTATISQLVFRYDLLITFATGQKVEYASGIMMCSPGDDPT